MNNQKKPFRSKKNEKELLVNSNLLSQKELSTINKTLKKAKKTKVLNVLTLEDLDSWTLIPKIPFASKKDKIREVVILMAYLGLRVSEAIDFKWDFIQLKNSFKFKVIGKGNKERYVFNLFDNEYIKTKVLLLKSQRVIKIDYPLTRFGVRDYLKRLAFNLQWSWTPNPHDFRRAFASACLYQKNINKLALQQLLGHSFFSTTEKYLRKDPRTLEMMLAEFLK